MSASEAELLAALAGAPNNRLETREIAAMIGGAEGISKATIKVRVVRLRKKLDAAGVSGQPINAVRNVGYQLAFRIDMI